MDIPERFSVYCFGTIVSNRQDTNKNRLIFNTLRLYDFVLKIKLNPETTNFCDYSKKQK
jgi:hypothetical protein